MGLKPSIAAQRFAALHRGHVGGVAIALLVAWAGCERDTGLTIPSDAGVADGGGVIADLRMPATSDASLGCDGGGARIVCGESTCAGDEICVVSRDPANKFQSCAVLPPACACAATCDCLRAHPVGERNLGEYCTSINEPDVFACTDAPLTIGCGHLE